MNTPDIEKYTEAIIDVGAEIDTHRDGDAFIRTFTFNDAQIEALLTTAIEEAEKRGWKRGIEDRNSGWKSFTR